MSNADSADAQLQPLATMLISSEAHTYSGDGDATLPYRFVRPLKVDEGKKYPLVVFLHGAGERGDDNARQLVWSEPLADPALRARHPAYVLIPQCPADNSPLEFKTLWTPAISLRDKNLEPKFADKPAAAMALVSALIDKLLTELPIDDKRIYVAGLSMGGFGTWDLAMRRPDLPAAIVPICGGGDSNEVKRIVHIPTWVVHGAADDVVPPEYSRRMVAALRAAGGSPVYTELEGVGHNSWSPAMNDRMLWDWLFSQKKE